MREAKYRVYDKKYKKMLNIHKMYFKNGKAEGVSFDLGGVISGYMDLSNNDYVLMQFTGLKDKNGKEIYEGDIVKWVKHEQKPTFEVVWDKYKCLCFQFYDIMYGGKDSYDLSLHKQMEVIGNIYEHKLLIEQS